MSFLEKIGNISIRDQVHRDALVSVYTGFLETEKRDVWVKVSLDKNVRGTSAMARFEAEASALAAVKHPNLIPVLDFGSYKGHAYLASAYQEGTSLAHLIEKGRMPANLAALVLQDIGKGLRAAHEKEVLHLNLKPSNILVGNDGRIGVTGFNVGPFGSMSAAMERGRSGMAYRPLEQWDGEAVSPSTDLFSLGAILFEMLTGDRAFAGENLEHLREQIAGLDPVGQLHDVDEVPVQLRRICQQLLKKRTEQRYQDCSVLQSDLDAYRMARGQAAVAATAHLAQFVQNPEEYRTRFPDRPVTVAPRSAAQHQRKAAASKQVRPGKDAGKESKPVRVSRILGIVAIFVFFFAGLSVAGNFFFSKDGQFGSTAQTPGASRPAESEPGGVTVARRGNENGKASVGSDGAGDVDGGPMASPIGNLKTIVVVGELLESETDTTRQRAEVAPRPASAAPDSVLLQDDPARPRGRVYIKADPWAAVFIDGDSLGVTPLPVVVSPGGYRITLRHPDFPDFETLVDVLPGRESPVEVSLWSLMGLLDLEVEPGVQLFIDGVDRGVTPFEYPLLVSPGKHGLILQHPTHGAYQSSIEIAAGEAQTFRYELNPTP